MPRKYVYECACGCGANTSETGNWIIVGSDSNRLTMRAWSQQAADTNTEAEFLASKVCCVRYLSQWIEKFPEHLMPPAEVDRLLKRVDSNARPADARGLVG